MRRIYMIRHGRPDVSEQERWCIGSTDLELGTLGRMQAACLAAVLQASEITAVFCSPLIRSIQTARYLSKDPIVLPGLREQDFGEWDGKSFDEIRRNWPELYEARGRDRSLLPPGAEPAEEVAQRFVHAVTEALEQSEGDIAIVAHQSVMGIFLCHILGEELCTSYRYRFAYGSVTVLEYAEEETAYPDGGTYRRSNAENTTDLCQMRLCRIDQKPIPELSEAVCQMLLQESGQPIGVIAHCALVAELTRRFGQALIAAQPIDQQLDLNLAVCCGWLHDLARTQPHHAQTAAFWLEQLGYRKAAQIVGQHHSLQDPELLDEAALVCLADCCAENSSQVTIEQRFAKSREKCRNEAAVKAHRRRYEEAMYLKEQLNRQCGKEVVL